MEALSSKADRGASQEEMSDEFEHHFFRIEGQHTKRQDALAYVVHSPAKEVDKGLFVYRWVPVFDAWADEVLQVIVRVIYLQVSPADHTLAKEH